MTLRALAPSGLEGGLKPQLESHRRRPVNISRRRDFSARVEQLGRGVAESAEDLALGGELRDSENFNRPKIVFRFR